MLKRGQRSILSIKKGEQAILTLGTAGVLVQVVITLTFQSLSAAPSSCGPSSSSSSSPAPSSSSSALQVLDDGTVSDTFSHKSLLPEDMDPLTVSGTIHPDGTLVVSVRRMEAPAGQEKPGVPTYRTEAHL